MKIAFIVDRPDPWIHGIWWHRVHIPANALKNRGHEVKQVCMGGEFTPETLDWPDVVVFGRTYPNQYNPIKWMNEYKKLGKRIVYDMDDDFWNVEDHNPSQLVSNALKDQYEGMAALADVVITPSNVLAKKFKKYLKKKVCICPNGTTDDYVQRRGGNQKLVIGYMGASSHWKDLQLIGSVMNELNKKYDFLFFIYGIVGESLESFMYYTQRYKNSGLYPEKVKQYEAALDFNKSIQDMSLMHVPFMPPELHPVVLSKCNFDIGLAPLVDSEFNRGKSCVKFYEYASVGTVTIASDVLPYSEEVNYRAKNTFKDWYSKLEKLIVDEKFRNKIAEEQFAWVKKHRSLDAIGLDWELALQGEGFKGLTVANQKR